MPQSWLSDHPVTNAFNTEAHREFDKQSKKESVSYCLEIGVGKLKAWWRGGRGIRPSGARRGEHPPRRQTPNCRTTPTTWRGGSSPTGGARSSTTATGRSGTESNHHRSLRTTTFDQQLSSPSLGLGAFVPLIISTGFFILLGTT